MELAVMGTEPRTSGLGRQSDALPGAPEQNAALFQSLMAMLASLGGPLLQAVPEAKSAPTGSAQADPLGATAPVDGHGSGALGFEAAQVDSNTPESPVALPSRETQQLTPDPGKVETPQEELPAQAAPATETKGISLPSPASGPMQQEEMAEAASGPAPEMKLGAGAADQMRAVRVEGDGEAKPSGDEPGRSTKDAGLPRGRIDPTQLSSTAGGMFDAVQNGKAAPTALSESPNPEPSPPSTPGEQVLHQVRISLERGEDRATLQLEPSGLGKVQIDLRFQGGQLHLSLRAEQGKTGHLLHRELHALRFGLEEQGVRVGDLRVVAGSEKVWDEASRGQVFHQMKTSISSMGGDVDPRSQQQGTPFFGYGDPGQGNRSPYRQGGFTATYGPGPVSGPQVEPPAARGGLALARRAQGLDLYI